MLADSFVIIGKIGKSFGVKGWVKVFSYTDPPAQLLGYTPLFYRLNSTWLPFHSQAHKQQGTTIILHPENCHTPEEAQYYCHAMLGIPQTQLPPLSADDYYWTDLEGLKVINQQGVQLGIVDHLIATASNDVLVVKGKKTHYIPYIRPQFVVQIDLAQHKLCVDWDEDF